jgi:hypothetical protein
MRCRRLAIRSRETAWKQREKPRDRRHAVVHHNHNNTELLAQAEAGCQDQLPAAGVAAARLIDRQQSSACTFAHGPDQRRRDPMTACARRVVRGGQAGGQLLAPGLAMPIHTRVSSRIYSRLALPQPPLRHRVLMVAPVVPPTQTFTPPAAVSSPVPCPPGLRLPHPNPSTAGDDPYIYKPNLPTPPSKPTQQPPPSPPQLRSTPLSTPPSPRALPR